MNIDKLVRPNIKALKPYTSARESYLDGILLDANENSLGSVITKRSLPGLNRYPDPNHKRLRSVLGRYLKVNPKNIFCGVGSDEIIDLLIRIFCTPGIDNVITLEPTYGMYKVACDINGVNTIPVQLNSKFQIDLRRTVKCFTAGSKLLFVCSPNNPTGNLINKNDLITLAKKFKGIVAVDEAYVEFSGRTSLAAEALKMENLVILRTFSKAWGMAGIRFGYAIADESIIDYLYKIKAPYNMNKLSGEAVIEAVSKAGRKNKYVENIIENRKQLIQEMRKNPGVKKIFPTDSNFILFECGNPVRIYKKLVEKGIIIRDRSSQIKDCLRVTVGTKRENKYFIEELRKAL